MNHKNTATDFSSKPSLNIEYDGFIDDVKTDQVYLYLEDIFAVFNQGGSLKFIISYCNQPIPLQIENNIAKNNAKSNTKNKKDTIQVFAHG